MTREEFDNQILYIEQDTGITAPPEEIAQLWELWKDANPFLAKLALRLGLILWHFQVIDKEAKEKHFKN